MRCNYVYLDQGNILNTGHVYLKKLSNLYTDSNLSFTSDMILSSISIKIHLLEGLRPTIVPRYLNIKENTNLDNVDVLQRLTCS